MTGCMFAILVVDDFAIVFALQLETRNWKPETGFAVVFAPHSYELLTTDFSRNVLLLVQSQKTCQAP